MFTETRSLVVKVAVHVIGLVVLLWLVGACVAFATPDNEYTAIADNLVLPFEIAWNWSYWL